MSNICQRPLRKQKRNNPWELQEAFLKGQRALEEPTMILPGRLIRATTFLSKLEAPSSHHSTSTRNTSSTKCRSMRNTTTINTQTMTSNMKLTESHLLFLKTRVCPQFKSRTAAWLTNFARTQYPIKLKRWIKLIMMKKGTTRHLNKKPTKRKLQC